jgi:hypothetical protein
MRFMSPGSLLRRTPGCGIAYRVAAKKCRMGKNGCDVKAAIPHLRLEPETCPWQAKKPLILQILTR